MKVNRCWHCGIPLDRAVKYVGIADVVLGLLHFIIMTIHVKEVFEHPYSSSYMAEKYDGVGYRSFPTLDWIPKELGVIMLIALSVQMILGVGIYIGAANRSRSICQFWLVMTGLTALFTFTLLRIYEMIIVNEFSNELKEEQVTYFNGQQQQQNFSQPQQQQQQPMQLVDATPATNINVVSGGGGYGPGGGGGMGAYSQVYNSTPGTGMTNQYGAQYSQQPPSNPAFQSSGVPSALQPPPQYDAVLRDDTGGWNNRGFTASTTSGLYPGAAREEKGFGMSYSRY